MPVRNYQSGSPQVPVPSIRHPAACKLVASQDHIMAAEVVVLVEQHDLNKKSEGTEGPQVSVNVFLDNN